MLLLGGCECGFLHSLHSCASFLSPKKTLAPPRQFHCLVVPDCLKKLYSPDHTNQYLMPRMIFWFTHLELEADRAGGCTLGGLLSVTSAADLSSTLLPPLLRAARQSWLALPSHFSCLVGYNLITCQVKVWLLLLLRFWRIESYFCS